MRVAIDGAALVLSRERLARPRWDRTRYAGFQARTRRLGSQRATLQLAQKRRSKRWGSITKSWNNARQ
jgi:hypothetical protein